MPMALTPEIRKLLQQALKVRDAETPLHRVLDVLATEDGDVSKAVNRYRDIQEPALRKAFHACALLLRELEREAGLAPAWETASAARAAAPAAASGGGGGSSVGSSSAAAPAAPAKLPAALKGGKLRPEELIPFENEAFRGKARMGKLYVDGASKGNPGQAGIGAVLFAMGGEKIGQLSRALGLATNNQAEYIALREGLEMAARLAVPEIFVFSDSELMVKQLKGEYKIKNPDIQERAAEIRKLIKGLEKFSITWIPREKNQIADALSTACIGTPRKIAGKKTASEDFMGDIDETADEGETE